MFSEHTQAHGVKSQYPHAAHPAVDEALDSFTHFTGRFVSKSNRQYPLRMYSFFYETGYPVGHGRGLAAARSREYQQRSLCMQSRLLLLFIEMI